MARTAVSNRATVPVFQNLLTRSEEFDNAAWATINASVTADQIANPVDGLTTADQIFETADAGSHAFYRGFTGGRIGSIMTLSVFAKDNNRQYICLSGNDAVVNPNATFDLTNGTITNKSGSTLLDASITSFGDGWYRCSITFTRSGVFNYNMIYLNNSSGAIGSYAGDTGKSVYIFGAQLAETNWLSPYVQTLATAVNTGNLRDKPPVFQNLLIRSEEFDNASWTKVNSAVTANQAVAPDGNTTMDLFLPDAGTAIHWMYQLIEITNRQVYITVSVYAKAAGYNWLGIGYGSQAVATGAFFNLSTGVLGTVPVGGEASIESMGNGVYRCSLTRLWTANDTKYLSIEAHTADNEGYSFNADGTSGVYIWGAQAVKTNYVTPYVQTVASAVNTGNIRNKAASRQVI